MVILDDWTAYRDGHLTMPLHQTPHWLHEARVALSHIEVRERELERKKRELAARLDRHQHRR